MNKIYSVQGTIDKLRESIRQVSDDTVYTDEYLYSKLLDIRNDFLYKSLSKRKFVPSELYTPICAPLEKSNQIPCDCIPTALNCQVLKTVNPIPEAITTSVTSMMIVMSTDFASEEYPYIDLRFKKYTSNSRTNSNTVYYTRQGEYLYLIGYPNNSLKMMGIKLIPKDPIEILNAGLCKDESECYNLLNLPFNFYSQHYANLISTTRNEIIPSIEIPEDISNNAQSVLNKI